MLECGHANSIGALYCVMMKPNCLIQALHVDEQRLILDLLELSKLVDMQRLPLKPAAGRLMGHKVC